RRTQNQSGPFLFTSSLTQKRMTPYCWCCFRSSSGPSILDPLSSILFLCSAAEEDHQPDLGLVIFSQDVEVIRLGQAKALEAEQDFTVRAAGNAEVEAFVAQLIGAACFVDMLLGLANLFLAARARLAGFLDAERRL